MLIASGAAYRSLPLERWGEFEDSGIFYAATELEARACAGRPVAVLGGGNSAGQAALFLSTRECAVNLVLRGDDLAAEMSDYLVQRMLADPRVTVADRHRGGRAGRRPPAARGSPCGRGWTARSGRRRAPGSSASSARRPRRPGCPGWRWTRTGSC